MDTFFENLNWVDMCLSIALLGMLLIGFSMGFYRQLVLFGCTAGGFLLASTFGQALSKTEYFRSIHANYGESGAEALGYGLVLATSLIAGLTILLLFRKLFSATMRLFDCAIGAIVGLGLGCALFGSAVLGLYQIEETKFHEAIRESTVGSRLAEGARVAGGMFPEDIRSQIESSFREHARILLVEESAEVEESRN